MVVGADICVVRSRELNIYLVMGVVDVSACGRDIRFRPHGGLWSVWGINPREYHLVHDHSDYGPRPHSIISNVSDMDTLYTNLLGLFYVIFLKEYPWPGKHGCSAPNQGREVENTTQLWVAVGFIHYLACPRELLLRGLHISMGIVYFFIII